MAALIAANRTISRGGWLKVTSFENNVPIYSYPICFYYDVLMFLTARGVYFQALGSQGDSLRHTCYRRGVLGAGDGRAGEALARGDGAGMSRRVKTSSATVAEQAM